MSTLIDDKMGNEYVLLKLGGHHESAHRDKDAAKDRPKPPSPQAVSAAVCVQSLEDVFAALSSCVICLLG